MRKCARQGDWARANCQLKYHNLSIFMKYKAIIFDFDSDDSPLHLDKVVNLRVMAEFFESGSSLLDKYPNLRSIYLKARDLELCPFMVNCLREEIPSTVTLLTI